MEKLILLKALYEFMSLYRVVIIPGFEIETRVEILEPDEQDLKTPVSFSASFDA